MQQSVAKPLIRPCTRVWLLMVILTFVTYSARWLGLTDMGVVLAVLIIALVKAQMVIDYFMGLRRVRGFWRPLLFGYLIVLGGLITTAFALASQ